MKIFYFLESTSTSTFRSRFICWGNLNSSRRVKSGYDAHFTDLENDVIRYSREGHIMLTLVILMHDPRIGEMRYRR
jgi:hypothetical protein